MRVWTGRHNGAVRRVIRASRIVSIVAVLLATAFGAVHASMSTSPYHSMGKMTPAIGCVGVCAVAKIPHPVGVAATSTELLVTEYGNNSSVYLIHPDGSNSTFAVVPTMDPNTNITSIAISPGLGGFPLNEVYVGQGNYIFQISPNGKSVSLFATLSFEEANTSFPTEITFDTVGSFGYNMVVSSGEGGELYNITANGTIVDNYPFNGLDEPVFGLTVSPLSFGQGGNLLATLGGPYGYIASVPPQEWAEYGFLGNWTGSTSITTVPSGLCTWDDTSDSYFIADNSSSEIEEVPPSIADLPNQVLVTSANTSVYSAVAPVGIGNLSSSGGPADLLYPSTDNIWASTWVSCRDWERQVTITNGNWYPYEMAYDPEDYDMYVTDNESDKVYFFDSASQVIGNATVGTNSTGVVYDPANQEMLVANSASNNVSIFNAGTNTVTGSIGVGLDPQGLAYDPHNHYVYVADNGSNALSVIAPDNEVVLTIPTNPEPFGITYDKRDADLYTANYGGTVSVINGTAMIASYKVNGAATGIVRDPRHGDGVFVTISSGSQVGRIKDGLVSYISVGEGPFGIAFDPQDGLLYVSNHISGTLSILRGTVLIETVQISEPNGPWGVAYDPANGLIYIAGDIVGDPRTIGGGGG